jgi:hypothetical protein
VCILSWGGVLACGVRGWESSVPSNFRVANQPTGYLESVQLSMLGESGISNVTSSLGQTYAPEKILKALIRAVSVKNRVDGEVSHPNSLLVIGGLQPFECALLLV